jgi:hypothetical protein
MPDHGPIKDFDPGAFMETMTRDLGRAMTLDEIEEIITALRWHCGILVRDGRYEIVWPPEGGS